MVLEKNVTVSLKEIIFVTNRITNRTTNFLSTYLPLTPAQTQILQTIIILTLLFIAISAAEKIKKPIRIAIIALLIWLLIGFFKP